MLYPVSDTWMDPPCLVSDYQIEPVDEIGVECDICGKTAEHKVTYQRFAKLSGEWTKVMCRDCYVEHIPEDARNNVA